MPRTSDPHLDHKIFSIQYGMYHSLYTKLYALSSQNSTSHAQLFLFDSSILNTFSLVIRTCERIYSVAVAQDASVQDCESDIIMLTSQAKLIPVNWLSAKWGAAAAGRDDGPLLGVLPYTDAPE